jgi:hypothetical protein
MSTLRSVLGFSPLPIQLSPGTLSLEKKKLNHYEDHSPPSSAVIRAPPSLRNHLIFSCQDSAHFSLDLNIQISKPAKLGSYHYSAVTKNLMLL